MNIENLEEKINKDDQEIRAKSRARRMKAESSMFTDRPLEEYEHTLEIPITEEFLGKTVLDLGSGVTGKFARDVAKRGIDIYSLSGAWGSEKIRKAWKEELIKSEEGRKALGRSVAGLAQELPFKSNVFDSVLSSWAIPYHLDDYEENRDEFEASFREIARVLKPGGKAYLAPVTERLVGLKCFNEIKNALKKEGLADIDVQEVKGPKDIDRYKIILTKLGGHTSSF